MTRNIDDAEGPAIFQGAFLIRSNGNFVNNLRWSDVLRGFNNATPGDTARRQVVRYDSPDWHGLVLSASWGDDDIWDAALTYKQVFGDFSVLARAGYGANNDPGTLRTTPQGNFVIGGLPYITTSLPNFECTWQGAAATVKHEPTGLFVFGGWGHMVVDTGNTVTEAKLIEPDSTPWFVRPGIEKKWCEFGLTEIFANYRHDDPAPTPAKPSAPTSISGRLALFRSSKKPT
jgi:hypothetical protein